MHAPVVFSEEARGVKKSISSVESYVGILCLREGLQIEARRQSSEKIMHDDK
jgi:hypothetical protein